MKMTDEQAWTDLARFALAMKRGAVVIFGDGSKFTGIGYADKLDASMIRAGGGIREIIEPPAKKVRPLNAEEWKSVAGCVLINGGQLVGLVYGDSSANWHMTNRHTCHPPGFPNDIRKLWVEE